MTCKYKVKIKDIQYNYKVQMTDIQSKYKFKVFCTGYDDSEIKEKIDAMYQAWPKVSGEGETITLNDTANTTMAIDLKGNTIQDGEPTPDAPVEIQVVSGDNTINICGKNLISNIDIFNGYPTGNNGGTIGYNISVNSITYKKCCYVIAGQEYTLSWKINTVKAVGYRDIKIVDNNNIILENFSYSNANNNRTKTFTPTKSGWIYAALDTNATEVQIEKGPIASEYVGLLGTTYPINLGSIELCKIENYKDRIYPLNGKWYLEKKIGKVVLNGSENWLENTPRFALELTGYASGTYRVYSDKFTYANAWQTHTETNNTTILYKDSAWNAARLSFNYNGVANVNEWKNWLSANNVIAYYPLATSTNTEITDATLISQLNALAGAESYSGQTNISQVNNDKPFIITAKALKDLSSL